MASVVLYALEVELRKRKVKRNASDLFGGTIHIRLSTLKSSGVPFMMPGGKIDALFPRSSLGHLNFVDTAGHLLCAALGLNPRLRSCNNFNSFAYVVAQYLLCKYRFSPEILSGQGPYKPIIVIYLIVKLQEQDSSPSGVVDRVVLDGLDKLIIPENADKVITGVLRNCSRDSDEWAADYEKVEGGLVMGCVVNNVAEEMKCPICLEMLKKYQFSVRASCSHVFHQPCIFKWLKRTDSCPMCRSVCSVLV